MGEKILSISVAAYNVEKCLKKTIESIVSDEQILPGIELIIVNDGSKDDTSRIAHEFEKKYPQTVVVIDKMNGGYGSTINASLAAAKGKYFKLLDGDDWFETDNLRGFLEFLENSSADLVITPYYEIREGVSRIDSHTEIGKGSEIFSAVELKNELMKMHEIAVKTEALRRINTNITEKCFYTDAEYCLYAVAASETVSRYGEPIYCYVLGVEGQSVSIQGIRKHYTDFPTVARRMFSFYESFCQNFSGGKRLALDLIIENFSYHLYQAYMVLERPLEKRKELMELDHEIRSKYPAVYRQGMNSKTVKLLRKTSFCFYSLMCKRMLRS